MAYYTITLCILFCFAIFQHGLSGVLYIKNTRFSADVNEVLDTTTYKKFERIVTSSSECAVLCSAYACDTFYYDVTSGKCRYVIFMTQSDKVPRAPSEMENFIIGNSVCQSGWLQYRNNCILFSRNKTTWHNAKDECEQMGSKLINLQSTDLNDFIVRRNFGSDAWIGGRKTDVWRWEDNSVEIHLNSTGWAPEEPNGRGYCMQLWQERNYTWDDDDCFYHKNFLCQSTINKK